LLREAVAALLAERRPQPIPFVRPLLPEGERRAPGKPRRYAAFASAAQLPARLPGIDRVYLPLGEPLPALAVEVGVELPRAFFGREAAVRRQLAELPPTVKTALCHNWSAVALAREAGLAVHLGTGINLFNRAALDAAAPWGDEATLSYELTFPQARAVGRGGVAVYGRLPLMLTRNCPRGGKRDCAACPRVLVDRKGARFPLVCREGVHEIQNALPLWADDPVEGFDFIAFRFTDESPDRCLTVLTAWDEGRRPAGEFTRGLTRRGVL
ncbi:MAG: hypothetical protein J6X61_01630, partial [Clostridia bacterium]|nr:hypothetical protein [Clostridia bacterium]